MRLWVLVGIASIQVCYVVHASAAAATAAAWPAAEPLEAGARPNRKRPLRLAGEPKQSARAEERREKEANPLWGAGAETVAGSRDAPDSKDIRRMMDEQLPSNMPSNRSQRRLLARSPKEVAQDHDEQSAPHTQFSAHTRKRRARMQHFASHNDERLRRQAFAAQQKSKATVTRDAGDESERAPPEPERKLKCRVEKDLYLDFEEYKHYSCANCYNNMDDSIFIRKFAFKKEAGIWLYDRLNRRAHLPNDTDTILATFKAESTGLMWLDCCQQALDCCRRNAVYRRSQGAAPETEPPLADEPNRDYCPATWDGFECWPNTPAGRVVEHPCPDHVYFLDFVPVCSGRVSKQCFPNGSWFIRNQHEWSNFSNCTPLPLYETRMLIGSIWNIVSALVVGPSLLIFSRLPNRGGSKRVQILQNLLLWILIYYLFEASHKIGVITKIFTQGPNSDYKSSSSYHLSRQQPSSDLTGHSAQAHGSARAPAQEALDGPGSGALLPVALAPSQWPIDERSRRWSESASAAPDNGSLLIGRWPFLAPDHRRRRSRSSLSSSSLLRRAPRGRPEPPPEQEGAPLESWRKAVELSSSSLDNGSPVEGQSMLNAAPVVGRPGGDELAPLSDFRQPGKQRHNDHRSSVQSTPIVLLCWLVSLGIRITRQLGYAWMFTGAIYLCSVLHFAPAEPPIFFIRWLMILTNVLPLTLGLVYLVVRTIYEPSPLRLMLKLPYFYAINDHEAIDYLKASELDCWMFRSKYDDIEEIAEFPNLVLVILNLGLFIVTLFIMCRINRPGGTRQEMSLGHYFKAAGTLVLLYGAHYALLARLPNVDKKHFADPAGCVKAQLGYYAFQFVDGIQGILVSYMFCYKTQEGREVISKWWSSLRGLGNDEPRCLRRRPRVLKGSPGAAQSRLAAGGRLLADDHISLQQGPAEPHAKRTAATRAKIKRKRESNTSALNGSRTEITDPGREVTTELLEANEVHQTGSAPQARSSQRELQN